MTKSLDAKASDGLASITRSWVRPKARHGRISSFTLNGKLTFYWVCLPVPVSLWLNGRIEWSKAKNVRHQMRGAATMTKHAVLSGLSSETRSQSMQTIRAFGNKRNMTVLPTSCQLIQDPISTDDFFWPRRQEILILTSSHSI